MQNYFFGFLNYLFYLFLIYASACAQKVDLSSIEINIDIDDNGFTMNTIAYGETFEESGLAFIPIGSLMRTRGVELYTIKDNGKLKRIKNITETKVPNLKDTFYNDDSLLVFEIPAETRFCYTFFESCPDLMMLPILNLAPLLSVDSLNLSINVHDNYHLLMQILNQDSLSYLWSDTVRTDSSKIYLIKTKPPRVNNNSEISFKGFNEVPFQISPTPLIRMIACPQEYKGKEDSYFNNWLIQLYDSVSVLDENTMRIADSLVSGISQPDSIIKVLFNFVRNSIRGLSVYEGYESWQPKNVNYVINSRQGDCKDMSNLLVQLLRYKGIESYVGLTSIITGMANCDFPCLFSANHAICCVPADSGWQFMDPTDKGVTENFPGKLTQGRSVFIFGEKKGVFYDIPIIKGEKNKSIFELQLSVKENAILGKYKVILNGLSAGNLMVNVENKGKSLKRNTIRDFLDRYFNNVNFEIDDDCFLSVDYAIIQGTIEYPATLINKVGSKQYFQADRLINPVIIPLLNENRKDAFFTQTLDIIFNIELQLEDSPHLIEYGSVEIDETFASYTQDAFIEDRSLFIRGEFILNTIYFQDKEKGLYNKLIAKIKDSRNVPIIIK